MTGKVYLVGAGPGDPDLLTLRAARTLGLANVVLYDALVSPEVLALISPGARVLNVGKRCGRKSVTQGEINDLLVRFASAGEIVVRLKGGDPSIFGRAGEEIDVLCQAGIEVEVIPGVTASLAAAAKIQVSLTDRRCADQLLLISVHRRNGKQESERSRTRRQPNNRGRLYARGVREWRRVCAAPDCVIPHRAQSYRRYRTLMNSGMKQHSGRSTTRRYYHLRAC